MSTETLSNCLAKVLIAGAWADGEVQPEEVTFLKGFIMELPGMDDASWNDLNIYMSMPVEEDERLELIEDLGRVVRSEEDEEFVLTALDMIFKADGVISHDEFRAIEQVKNVLSKNTG